MSKRIWGESQGRATKSGDRKNGGGTQRGRCGWAGPSALFFLMTPSPWPVDKAGMEPRRWRWAEIEEPVSSRVGRPLHKQTRGIAHALSFLKGSGILDFRVRLFEGRRWEPSRKFPAYKPVPKARHDPSVGQRPTNRFVLKNSAIGAAHRPGSQT